MKKYNGHPSYNYWNVSLWIGNEEWLYRLALDMKREAKGRGGSDRAADYLIDALSDAGITHTPDGVPYLKSYVKYALVDL